MISIFDKNKGLAALSSDPIADLEGIANGTIVHLMDTGEDIIYDADNESWRDMTSGTTKSFDE